MAQEIENIQEKMNWHWRNSMRPVRFFAFDARAAVIVPILLLYPRLITLILTFLLLLFFRYLERKGLTFPAAIRNLRTWIVGKFRPGWVGAEKKQFIDYG